MRGSAAVATIVALGVACSSHDDIPDRWREVEQLAQPTIAAGTGGAGLFDAMIANVNTLDEDAPDAALDAAIAWANARGGLPWRLQKIGGKDALGSSVALAMRVGRVGKALIERRASHADALEAAMYLGQRLRGEGTTILDAALGFQIADEIHALHATERPTPAEIKYAPIEAEIRRGLAAEGVTIAAALADVEILVRANHLTYQRYVLDVPADRAPFLANFDAVFADAAKAGVSERALSSLVHGMFDQADAYQAWLAGP